MKNSGTDRSFLRKSDISAPKSSQTADEWTAQKQLIFPQQQDTRNHKSTIQTNDRS
jgi:hypothetical protein